MGHKETNLNFINEEYKWTKESGIYTVLQNGKPCDFAYSDGTDVETYISQAIKSSDDLSSDSEELMHKVKDWPSFYHLGIGRANLLRAFDTQIADKRVLELGAGCGALTRYLGETCLHVDAVEGSFRRASIARHRCIDLDNVDVYNSSFEVLNFEPKYEVVLLIGVLEYAPGFVDVTDPWKACCSLLAQALSALQPDGKLILAIENKLGLKYWNGSLEDHTGKFFGGIYGYPGEKNVVTYSKKELEKLLISVGVKTMDFYSCFPDYKFMTSIFKQSAGNSGLSLFNWIDLNKEESLLFDETLVLRSLEEAELLNSFANSFAVIAKKVVDCEQKRNIWCAKRFSLARKKKFRAITTLFKGSQEIFVEKKRVTSVAGDVRLVGNSFDIIHKVGKSDWYAGSMLTTELCETLQSSEKKQKLVKLYGQYYDQLLAKHGLNKTVEGFPLVSGEAFDYIFRNIIRTEAGMVAIDQEWSLSCDLSADYILYRCLLIDVLPLISANFVTRLINHFYLLAVIKSFFPKYNFVRHIRHRRFELKVSRLIGSANFEKGYKNKLSDYYDKICRILISQGLFFYRARR